MNILTLALKLSLCLKGFVNTILLGLLGSLVFFVVYQMLSRSIEFLPTFYWTEELSRFAFLWMVFLGSGTAVLHSDHFVLDAFPSGTKLDMISKIIRDISCFLLGIIFVIYGKDFASFGVVRTATASGLSMVYVYSTFMVCGGLMIIFGVVRFIVHVALNINESENVLKDDDSIRKFVSG